MEQAQKECRALVGRAGEAGSGAACEGQGWHGNCIWVCVCVCVAYISTAHLLHSNQKVNILRFSSFDIRLHRKSVYCLLSRKLVYMGLPFEHHCCGLL